MQIIDLAADLIRIDSLAELLWSAFREHAPESWPDLESARREVLESLEPGRISRVAIDEDNGTAGWIGGNPQYGGRVWELHPLVVRADRQRRGLGLKLVEDFESEVSARGGLMIILGTDDEDGRTSISGRDLFPDVLRQLAGIRNLRGHPYEFYQKVGFVLTGVAPGANGFGRPGILMAKPVR